MVLRLTTNHCRQVQRRTSCKTPVTLSHIMEDTDTLQPDLCNGKTCDRATFYEEIGHPLGPKPDSERKYLALYQSKASQSCCSFNKPCSS
jgi:hypothetical protein